MIHSDYDVIVVGAGPGGSIASKVSATNGFRTLVLEKRQEISHLWIGKIKKFYNVKKNSNYTDTDQSLI